MVLLINRAKSLFDGSKNRGKGVVTTVDQYCERISRLHRFQLVNLGD